MTSKPAVSNLTAAPASSAPAPSASSPVAADKPSASSAPSSSNESKEPLREVKSEVTSDGMRIESNWSATHRTHNSTHLTRQ